VPLNEEISPISDNSKALTWLSMKLIKITANINYLDYRV
jgi:hypothetical protein